MGTREVDNAGCSKSFMTMCSPCQLSWPIMSWKICKNEHYPPPSFNRASGNDMSTTCVSSNRSHSQLKRKQAARYLLLTSLSVDEIMANFQPESIVLPTHMERYLVFDSHHQAMHKRAVKTP